MAWWQWCLVVSGAGGWLFLAFAILAVSLERAARALGEVVREPWREN